MKDRIKAKARAKTSDGSRVKVWLKFGLRFLIGLRYGQYEG